GGIDRVLSPVTFSLASHGHVFGAIENLTLTGSHAVNSIGNALANTIIGNSAANALTGGNGDDVLNGGRGADVMYGGNGNDQFHVDNARDRVDDTAGVDT